MRILQLVKEAESLSSEELTRLIARLMVVQMREDEPEWTNHQVSNEDRDSEN